jgi:4-hydroxy-2-oxoglutarate aldolase
MVAAVLSLRGVFPPIPTPFDAEGEVDTTALVENLARWNGTGLAGYVVAGSNGEAAYLTDAEKRRLWEVARGAVGPGMLLIAGTGCESTRATIELTRVAAEAGADAVLVVTPHYFAAKMTPTSLLRHFEAVADAAPVPVLVYNVPGFTHVDLDAGTVARLAEHPNIIGAKDSGGNIAKMADIVRLAGPDFQMLAGSGGFFLPALAVGAVGCVPALGNVAPHACVDLQRLFERGAMDDAAALQRRLVPVNAAVTARFGVAGLKAAMDLLGYYGGPVRAPLMDLSEEERRILRQVLVDGGLAPVE